MELYYTLRCFTQEKKEKMVDYILYAMEYRSVFFNFYLSRTEYLLFENE